MQNQRASPNQNTSKELGRILELLLGPRAQHRGDVLSQDSLPLQAGGSHQPVVPDHDIVREVHLKDGGVGLDVDAFGGFLE